MQILEKFIDYGRMVKFSHSLFALPFAGLAAILAFLESDLMLRDIMRLSVLIIVAMISARSAAMGFNRYIDSEMDEKNPRTADREIPKGKISPASVLFFIGLSSFVFLFSSYLINMLCFVLAFPVLFILFFYSLAKRFTLLCHFILGIAISLAPLGAWLAIREEFDWIPMLFSLGLFLHIAGFDILYAIQDMDFDKTANLHSIPARFGEANSYRLAMLSHVISISFFVLAGYVAMLGWIYYLSLAIVVVLLFEEHKISHDYAKRLLPPRFYQINSLISLVIFLGILIDRWSEVLNKLELLVRL